MIHPTVLFFPALILNLLLNMIESLLCLKIVDRGIPRG
jgi:hypothetical protein